MLLGQNIQCPEVKGEVSGHSWLVPRQDCMAAMKQPGRGVTPSHPLLPRRLYLLTSHPAVTYQWISPVMSIPHSWSGDFPKAPSNRLGRRHRDIVHNKREEKNLKITDFSEKRNDICLHTFCFVSVYLYDTNQTLVLLTWLLVLELQFLENT